MSFMKMAMKIASKASDIFSESNRSKEAQGESKLSLETLKAEMFTMALEADTAALKAQAGIINAEAKSESWIARSWRPITMLTFVAIIVLHSLGFIELAPEFADKFMTLVQIGLGGYVLGRSAEKVIPKLNKNTKG